MCGKQISVSWIGPKKLTHKSMDRENANSVWGFLNRANWSSAGLQTAPQKTQINHLCVTSIRMIELEWTEDRIIFPFLFFYIDYISMKSVRISHKTVQLLVSVQHWDPDCSTTDEQLNFLIIFVEVFLFFVQQEILSKTVSYLKLCLSLQVHNLIMIKFNFYSLRP